MSLKELKEKPWARAVIVVTAPIWFPVAVVLCIVVLILGYILIGVAGLGHAIYNYIREGKFESEWWESV